VRSCDARMGTMRRWVASFFRRAAGSVKLIFFLSWVESGQGYVLRRSMRTLVLRIQKSRVSVFRTQLTCSLARSVN
jgi:hypothetical protein